jgi:hypothetical protein
MTYSLKKLHTAFYVGDSGPMSMFIPVTEDGKRYNFDAVEHNARPRVGGSIRVGSITGRTFAAQDWWQTSLITEILEEREDYVRFKTLNSEYEWERF